MQHIIMGHNHAIISYGHGQARSKSWNTQTEGAVMLKLLSPVFLDEALLLPPSCKKVIIYLDGP